MCAGVLLGEGEGKVGGGNDVCLCFTGGGGEEEGEGGGKGWRDGVRWCFIGGGEEEGEGGGWVLGEKERVCWERGLELWRGGFGKETLVWLVWDKSEGRIISGFFFLFFLFWFFKFNWWDFHLFFFIQQLRVGSRRNFFCSPS